MDYGDVRNGQDNDERQQFNQGGSTMSVSSKKRKRHVAWEESLGGAFPTIAIDDQHEGLWLQWIYCVAPFEVRVEINLMADQAPWLYIEERNQQIVCEAVDDEQSRMTAEAQYGALTRIRLMEAHRAAIVANRAAGLAQLEAAATAAGLYGKRERRRCVIPSWTTEDDTAAAQLLIDSR
jgi:hypothetical protein